MATYQRQSIISYGKAVPSVGSLRLLGFGACLSHGETNYIIDGDISIDTSVDGWVVLEVHRDSGELQCITGDSKIDIVNALPLSADADQLVFNSTENVCYRRFNNEWVEVVAINIGRVESGKFDKHAVGSQLGTVENVSATRIYFDQDGLPLVFRNGTKFRFATIADSGEIKLQSGIMHFSFSGSVDFGTSTETIPEFAPISFSDTGHVKLYDGSRSPIGISIKGCSAGEKVIFISSGYAYNQNWNFIWSGYSVYAYGNGTIGQGIDLTQNYLQACGKATNAQSMIIDIAQRIKVLEHEDV